MGYGTLCALEACSSSSARSEHEGSEYRSRTEEWFAAYGERLQFAMMRVVGNWQEAEDVCQETFLRCLERGGQFREEASPWKWIYGIARNVAVDRHRKYGRIGVSADHAIDGATDNPLFVDRKASSPLDHVICSEAVAFVRQSLCGLDAGLGVLLRMREMDEMSYNDIRDQTELELGTVKSRLHRARRLFRDLFCQASRQNPDEVIAGTSHVSFAKSDVPYG